VQTQVLIIRVPFIAANGDNHVQMSKFVALIFLASAMLAGCSSTPVAQVPAQPAAAPMPTPATSSTPKPVASSTVATVSLAPHLDPKSLISTERSVYFDFDVFSIKSEYSALIERHGKYLASKPALSIKIEGNADERGSAEYNLALGQKRAQAVLQALKIYGAKEGQMEAVSWGKERPKATGHDETAWAENRRADLVYPKQ
jgi:peptidoglycan-associated lipoprotein